MDKQWAREKATTLDSVARYLAGQVEAPEWPLELFLEVSNLCDLKCAMCPTFSPLNPKRFNNLQRERRGLLDLDQLAPQLDALLRHALVVHTHGYGEPTIHPRFRDLLKKIGEYGGWIDFFTHGMHIDEEFARFLVEQKVGRVTFSFSGSSREEYENIYIGGEFDRVLQGMEWLRREKARAGQEWPDVHVNSIGFEHHIARLPEFVRVMAEHGVSMIHIKPLATYDTIPQLHGHVSILGEEESRILEEARVLAQTLGICLSSKPYEQFRARSREEAEQIRAALHKGRTVTDQKAEVGRLAETAAQVERVPDTASEGTGTAKRISRTPLSVEDTDVVSIPAGIPPCIEPYKTLYCDLNGNVKPCCFASGHKRNLGSLFEEEGRAIWSGAPYTYLRNLTARLAYPALFCAQCIKGVSFPRIIVPRPLMWVGRLTGRRRDRWRRRLWVWVTWGVAQVARIALPHPKDKLFLARYGSMLLALSLQLENPDGPAQADTASRSDGRDSRE